jgi:SLT domain-containing protein
LEVAELTATLDAKLEPLARALSQADALLVATRRELKSVEEASAKAGVAMGQVKMRSGQAAETTGVIEAIKRGLGSLRDKAVDTTRSLRDVKMTSRQAAEDTAVTEVLIANQNRLQRQIRQTRREQAFGGGGGTGLGALGSIVPGGGRATGAAFGVAVAGAAALAAPLAPAVGIIAAIPGLVAPAVAALGVLALSGFGDVTKAIGGNKKAYQDLLPAQKAFVDSIRQLVPLLNGMKQIVGSNLFGPMAAALQSVARNASALSQIGGILRGMSQLIGNIAASWIKFLGSTQFLDSFRQTLSTVAPMWQQLSGAMQAVVQGLVNMGVTFKPLEQFLTDAAVKAANFFKEWSKSKDAKAANDAIITSLKLLAQTADALISIIKGLFDILKPVGTLLLSSLNPLLKEFGQWLQKNSQTISGVLINALEGLISALKGVIAFIKPFGPTIEEVFKVWGEAIKGMGMEVEWLGNHMHWLADATNWATKNVVSAVSWMASGVSTAIGGIKTVIQDVANGLIWLVNHIPIPTFKTVLGIPIPTGVRFLNIGSVDLSSSGGGNPPGIQGPTGSGGGGQQSTVPPGVHGANTGGSGFPNFSPTPISPTGSADPFTGGAAGSGGRTKKNTGANAYINPFLGRGQGRIDQGQDFSGSGPILAIGDGIVRRAASSGTGWPGGGWVSITLTSGPRAGWTYYVAEYLTPKVSAGQHVRKGQVIAEQNGGIEAGWVASPTQGSAMAGNALSSQLGQNAIQRGLSSDPGGVPSPQGQDFARFLGSIGVGGHGRAKQPSALDLILPPGMQAGLAAAQQAVVSAKGPAAMVTAEKAYVAELEKIQTLLDHEKMTGDALVRLNKEKLLIAKDLKKAQSDLITVENTQHVLGILRPVLGGTQTPGTGMTSLRKEYAAIEAEIRKSGIALAGRAELVMRLVAQAMEKPIRDSKMRDIVRQLLDGVKSVVDSRAAAIKTAIAAIKSAMDSMQSTALSAFDAINQKWKSPAQQKLDAMQKEDQANQLKQNLSDAITQYGAGSQQAKDAQRAIDEAALAQQAQDEQTAHDAAVKAKKDQFEKEYAALQIQLAKTHASAETAARALRTLYRKYGLTPSSVQAVTDWNTAQSLFVAGMAGLTQAINSLYTAITGKKAPGGGKGGAPIINPDDPLGGGGGVPATNLIPPMDKHRPFGYAAGGLARAVPGGMYRVAEAGHDEMIIPLDPSRRSRAMQLMHHAANIVGFADGGVPKPPKGLLPQLGPGQKINPTTGLPDVPAFRAAAMYLNDAGRDKNDTPILSALIGSLGPGAQAKASMRATTTFDGYPLRQGLWRGTGGVVNQQMISGWKSLFPNVVFETGTPGEQISWMQAASRLPLGGQELGGLIQNAYAGGSKRGSLLEHATSHAVHFSKGGYVRARPGGTLALLGEGGRDEMVTPVGGGGGGGDIHHHIYIDSTEIAHTITERQLRSKRYGGVGFQSSTRS